MDITAQQNCSITINGILVPVSWNSSGEVICLAVSTFDEKEYRIDDQNASNMWHDYLNREVTVKGRPYQRGTYQWITVQSFQIMAAGQHSGIDTK